MAVNGNDAITLGDVPRNRRYDFIRQAHVGQRHEFRVEIGRFGLSDRQGGKDTPRNHEIENSLACRFRVGLHCRHLIVTHVPKLDQRIDQIIVFCGHT